MKKMLLTSQMIHNKSIADALAKLLGKPFAEAKIAYIITSHNSVSVEKSWFVQNINSLYDLGWETFYMIDVAGEDGLPKESWMSKLEEADVIAIGGGSNFFLSYWIEKSGLMDELPRLLESKIYIGASAGSLIIQPSWVTASVVLKFFSKGEWKPDMEKIGFEGRRSSKTLGLIDFLIRPHYKQSDNFITDELLSEVSSSFGFPLYALDDDSAIQIVGDEINVISEGRWKRFQP